MLDFITRRTLILGNQKELSDSPTEHKIMTIIILNNVYIYQEVPYNDHIYVLNYILYLEFI